MSASSSESTGRNLPQPSTAALITLNGTSLPPAFFMKTVLAAASRADGLT